MAPGIAEIGGLMGDPARAAMLSVLIDGRALPAGELAFAGNVAPQTASFHLAKLVGAGLLSVESQGKHKYYRLANERVASALEALAAIGPAARTESLYESEQTKGLRFARSCYRHLAGRLAVEIYRSLVNRKFLTIRSAKENCLTDSGERWAEQIGMQARVYTGKACLDWTERHHHLGGPLGVSLFSCLKENKWIAQKPGTRIVRLTHTGEKNLADQLGVVIR